MKPEIFLVTGDRSDAGKTTITCALIRKFRREGVKAIGFKPFGSNVLFDDLDLLMSRFPSGKAALYGRDALRIAEASDLSDEAMIELIAPVHFLGFTRHVDTLLVRAGSGTLEDRVCFSTELFHELMQRRDLLALFDRLFPWHPSARAGEKQRIGMLDLQLARRCEATYDYLRATDPDVLVVEGAGPILPVWNSGIAGHVLYLSGARIDLYTDVTMNVSNGVAGLALLWQFNGSLSILARCCVL